MQWDGLLHGEYDLGAAVDVDKGVEKYVVSALRCNGCEKLTKFVLYCGDDSEWDGRVVGVV